ncbi:MAG: hypothetical protein ABSA78_19295 [Candidatus Sulfotelmatobacter sp.]
MEFEGTEQLRRAGVVLSADLDTSPKDELETREALVVFFDICSSSNILEGLHSRDNLKAYRDFLITIKRFLRHKQNVRVCEIYKFIGDGWILLFPPTTTGSQLLKFLAELTELFCEELKKSIIPALESTPQVMGLTFGADAGLLIETIMNDQKEYIGRPLNIASRLQGAVKESDGEVAYNPAYKILISKPTFHGLRVSTSYPSEPLRRKLRNILGGQHYECVRLTIPQG